MNKKPYKHILNYALTLESYKKFLRIHKNDFFCIFSLKCILYELVFRICDAIIKLGSNDLRLT